MSARRVKCEPRRDIEEWIAHKCILPVENASGRAHSRVNADIVVSQIAVQKAHWPPSESWSHLVKQRSDPLSDERIDEGCLDAASDVIIKVQIDVVSPTIMHSTREVSKLCQVNETRALPRHPVYVADDFAKLDEVLLVLVKHIVTKIPNGHSGSLSENREVEGHACAYKACRIGRGDELRQSRLRRTRDPTGDPSFNQKAAIFRKQIAKCTSHDNWRVIMSRDEMNNMESSGRQRYYIAVQVER